MKDPFIYPNAFNSINFYKMKAKEQGLAFAAIKKYRDLLLEGSNADFVIFDYAELRSILDFKNREYKDFDEFMEGVENRLIKLTSRCEDDNVRTKIVIFPTVIFDKESRSLMIRINDDFKETLSFVNDKFTFLDFEEFNQLNRIYSRTLYRILKQWRLQGKVTLTIEEVREIFGTVNYSAGEMSQHIFKNSIKEFEEKKIKSFKGLKFDVEKKGKTITKFILTFQKEVQTLEEIKTIKALKGYDLLPKVSLENWLES